MQVVQELVERLPLQVVAVVAVRVESMLQVVQMGVRRVMDQPSPEVLEEEEEQQVKAAPWVMELPEAMEVLEEEVGVQE